MNTLILNAQLTQAQQKMRLMQQFFDEHGLREKKRRRGNDAQRLERLRAAPGYLAAYAEQPLISIIIPTYNRAQIIIERTLPSVLAQDYPHWELLIVGDCMEAEQAALLSEAAQADPRVRFHNLKHRGKYPATRGPRWYVAGTTPMNFGLRVARGAWISHLDDDDEFLPNHLSALLATAQAGRYEWAHAKVQFVTDQGVHQMAVGGELPSHGNISRIGSLYHAGLKTFRYNPGCWKYFYPGDWDLWERLLAMGVTHAHCAQVTALHHGDYFRSGVLDENAPPAPMTPAQQHQAWLAARTLAPQQLELQQQRQATGCRIELLIIDSGHDAAPGQATCRSIDAQPYAQVNVQLIDAVSDAPQAALRSINQRAQASDADWFVLLHAGDTLTPQALVLLADTVTAQPALMCCYGDEDALDAEGPARPIFKPDLNLDLLRSYPYLGRSLAIKREALLALGGLNTSLGELAHYDLVFRIIESHGLHAVGHIAEVLHHAQLPYAAWLGLASAAQTGAVVSAHLQRMGVAHEMLPGALPGINRVRYLHATQPAVSIIIPTRDQLPLINGLIDSLLSKTSYANYELLIVDNDSRDPAACAYLDGIERLNNPQLRVVRWPHPFNYSAINNFAAAQARGEYLILLNND
ncbi:MAG: glycosyltransferase family 2 protein, partial [Dyella sp.]